jgi:hypothetical protein
LLNNKLKKERPPCPVYGWMKDKVKCKWFIDAYFIAYVMFYSKCCPPV